MNSTPPYLLVLELGLLLADDLVHLHVELHLQGLHLELHAVDLGLSPDLRLHSLGSGLRHRLSLVLHPQTLRLLLQQLDLRLLLLRQVFQLLPLQLAPRLLLDLVRLVPRVHLLRLRADLDRLVDTLRQLLPRHRVRDLLALDVHRSDDQVVRVEFQLLRGV